MLNSVTEGNHRTLGTTRRQSWDVRDENSIVVRHLGTRILRIETFLIQVDTVRYVLIGMAAAGQFSLNSDSRSVMQPRKFETLNFPNLNPN